MSQNPPNNPNNTGKIIRPTLHRSLASAGRGASGPYALKTNQKVHPLNNRSGYPSRQANIRVMSLSLTSAMNNLEFDVKGDSLIAINPQETGVISVALDEPSTDLIPFQYGVGFTGIKYSKIFVTAVAQPDLQYPSLTLAYYQNIDRVGRWILPAQQLDIENDSEYVSFSGNLAEMVIGGQGVLNRIICYAATATTSIIVYDSTSASGTELVNWPTAGDTVTTATSIDLDLPYYHGLYLDVSGYVSGSLSGMIVYTPK